MNKEFIPYEQALALKELGFDEPCFMCWEIRDGKYVELGNFWKKGYRNSLDKKVTSAPTYSQAFRWFREKYSLRTWIEWGSEYLSCASIQYSDGSKKFIGDYSTNEEAELECLKKLIEIVKQTNP